MPFLDAVQGVSSTSRKVFPAAELPEVDTFEARQTDLMDALEAFDTVSPDARRAWRAAAMTAETARDERD